MVEERNERAEERKELMATMTEERKVLMSTINAQHKEFIAAMKEQPDIISFDLYVGAATSLSK